MTDRCPGVLRLHEAADGWLARVRLPGGRLAAEALRAIADVAQRGNGIIELTSRASLQIRGLVAGDGVACAEILGEAGLLPSPSHDRVRNILASPVAGRHPQSAADVDDAVRELDAAVCADDALARLSGRFLFAVLDGSPTLDARRADAVVAPRQNRAAAIHAAQAPTTLTPGVLRQRDGLVAVTAAVPLARLHPSTARILAGLAARHGTDVRIAPERTVTLVDIAPTEADGVVLELSSRGLVTRPSGWDGLTACAGRGACAKAESDVRALAVAAAARRAPGDPPEHWAACPRGCGRPPGVALRGLR
ncbi:MAG: hypothetical protein JOZ07_11035 [Solirubrobacterales bacterium]|nr:hypothetical protein [Solirubrobacterales bacterium]